MKTIQTLLVLGLLAGMQAVASAQTNSVTAANTDSKPRLHTSLPILQTAWELKQAKLQGQDRILRYQGLSSQAWTTIAGRHSDASLYRDCGIEEADFPLFAARW